MIPFYLECGRHWVAAIYEPAAARPAGTAVLLVPPFGWDDQTSYRPRRDWSLALAARGFANLRIDLPGTGDSSGTPLDEGLVASWASAVAAGVDWLRGAGARQVAIIALGAGGLISLQAIADGAEVDSLVAWGMPPNGRALSREMKAFGRLEQAQTGEPADKVPEDEMRAGGHRLAPATLAGLCSLDATQLVRARGPARALLLGRDAIRPDSLLIEAFASTASDVRIDPGHGWGAALERPQSTSPRAIFDLVNGWLEAGDCDGRRLSEPPIARTVTLQDGGAGIRETPLVFEAQGRQLYAILAEPADGPIAPATVVLFNAGAIRRIGPNRMWTEAARRWAARGVPVLRVDLEGIGDASGDSTPYLQSDESFYTEALLDQARATVDQAAARGLPSRFILGGLCSGAFWAFQVAVTDPRVEAVVALNPRMLIFDPLTEGHRDMRRLRRIATPAGLRNVLMQKRKLGRARRLVEWLASRPLQLLCGRWSVDHLSTALRVMAKRGQALHFAFSGGEPLEDELLESLGREGLDALGVRLHRLPYKSHTLKPLEAQQAAHALLDEVIETGVSVARGAGGAARAGAQGWRERTGATESARAVWGGT